MAVALLETGDCSRSDSDGAGYGASRLDIVPLDTGSTERRKVASVFPYVKGIQKESTKRDRTIAHTCRCESPREIETSAACSNVKFASSCNYSESPMEIEESEQLPAFWISTTV